MAPQAAAPAAPTARLNLYFRAKGIADLDTFSKSDPYIVLHAITQGAPGARSGQQQQRSFQVGRTETIMNDLNPVWKTPIAVDYAFEVRQEYAFVLYDDDGKGPQGDDVAAKGTFLLSHVVSGRRSTLEVKLQPKGTLTIMSEEVSNHARDTVSFAFAGSTLKKMDWFGLSDPYFKLFRIQPNGNRKLLFQSKPIQETLDPKWPQTPAISMAELSPGDGNNRCLLFECWDEDTFKDDKMGQFIVSYNELANAAARSAAGDRAFFKLVHATKSKEYGNIYVDRMFTRHIPTFTEFLSSGLQINLAASIDFTGSNGDPRNPRSLHFMDPVNPNQYVRAIMSVCDILMEYDSDKMVPAFGFGALLPGTSAANHCFHLNGQPDPHVHGVQGILDAYGQALQNVRLSGPTNFAPTVRQATAAARGSVGSYTILLIITDGCITDTDATIDAIVDAGDAPLSIIIVGVGNADFSLMNVLDGDDDRLKNRHGKPAARDLVQFVPFAQFLNAPREALAAEVLREVPQQVEEWAMIAHVTPEHFGSATAKY